MYIYIYILLSFAKPASSAVTRYQSLTFQKVSQLNGTRMPYPPKYQDIVRLNFANISQPDRNMMFGPKTVPGFLSLIYQRISQFSGTWIPKSNLPKISHYKDTRICEPKFPQNQPAQRHHDVKAQLCKKSASPTIPDYLSFAFQTSAAHLDQDIVGKALQTSANSTVPG